MQRQRRRIVFFAFRLQQLRHMYKHSRMNEEAQPHTRRRKRVFCEVSNSDVPLVLANVRHPLSFSGACLRPGFPSQSRGRHCEERRHFGATSLLGERLLDSLSGLVNSVCTNVPRSRPRAALLAHFRQNRDFCGLLMTGSRGHNTGTLRSWALPGPQQVSA